ncbi:TctA subunit of the tripartite Tricarboxylate transport(TTT) family protein [Aurantimonas aggregata]|uniref:TctA subunit of the tripartite Tricarboxylate transport(TTT) family protein n=1 Tax=Aurantimonas aggregata TaxID=2047720 RepID=A0A6L9MFZ2_9HYPH|nr:tripartite tricarboxylate transporter permease [Aurantimonas aggregata]NDV86576.1 TctA subunit of the tripartite Tricarboxylate transport(TTT) family protein [Aurantimonas aggregata]
MESLALLAGGVVDATAPYILLATLIGVVIGLMVGALPGLGPAAGVAIMLPVAVGFDGTAAIAALAGIYYGAMFGGAVTSILLGIPGDAPSVMTVVDGHAMAKKGEAGRALSMNVIASFIGGLIGILLLAILSVPIASAALSFGPTEMTALMCFALSLVSVLGGRNMLKGFVSLFIGMWIGMIGLDPIGGPTRFTFGTMHLFEGVDFTIVAVGLFGLSEMFMSLSTSGIGARVKHSLSALMPKLGDIVRCKWALLSGSIIGFVVGVLPGVGATASTMLAYALAKKTSRHPEEFGKGAIQGVAAPEAANNAASYASMIPLFTLGIPGSATTAVLLGGLLMVGLQPGPLLFANNPEFVWTVFGTFWTGNLMLVGLTILLIPVLASIVYISRGLLYPAVIGIVVFGVYSINFSLNDVGIALFAGVIGFVMLKLDYSPVPLILGLVLGPLLERGVRRTLILSEGDMAVFVERPISLFLFVLTAAVIFLPLIVNGVKAARTRRGLADAMENDAR